MHEPSLGSGGEQRAGMDDMALIIENGLESLTDSECDEVFFRFADMGLIELTMDEGLRMSYSLTAIGALLVSLFT